MGSGTSNGSSPKGAAKRGLWRLMLKLPAVRGTMRTLDGNSEVFANLCEAYEDTCTTLDRLLRAIERDAEMISEYRTISAEIETDVVRYCLERTNPSQNKT